MSDNQTVKFGDICREVKLTTKDPIADGYERYIGLEHLDSGSLKIKRWGMIAEDNPSFTRVFKKGHILFGKRRPYLKKAAIADFDGICSGDIIVLDLKKDFEKNIFIEAIIQSNRFWDWAVKTSSGSLSPRTKFKELANFPLQFPTQEEELSFNSTYLHLLDVSAKSSALLDSAYLVVKSIHHKYFGDYSLLPNKSASHCKTISLCEVSSVSSGVTPLKKNKSFWEAGDVPWTTSTEIHQKLIASPTNYVTKEAVNKCNLKLFQPGTVLVAITGEGKTRGNAAILSVASTINQHLAAIVTTENYDSGYLFEYLTYHYSNLRGLSQGTSRAAITCKDLLQIQVPDISIQEQKSISNSLAKVREMIDVISNKNNSLNQLKAGIIDRFI